MSLVTDIMKYFIRIKRETTERKKKLSIFSLFSSIVRPSESWWIQKMLVKFYAYLFYIIGKEEDENFKFPNERFSKFILLFFIYVIILSSVTLNYVFHHSTHTTRWMRKNNILLYVSGIEDPTKIHLYFPNTKDLQK